MSYRTVTGERSACLKRLVARLGAVAADPSARISTVLMRDLHMARTTVDVLLKLLRKQGVARVADWLRDGRGHPVPVWALGAGPDAPKPQAAPRHAVNVLTAPSGRRVLAWFEGGGRGTYRDVMSACAVSRTAAREMLRQLRAMGRVRVAGWPVVTAGQPMPEFVRADGKLDVPRPPARTPLQRRRDQYTRLAAQYSPEIAWRIQRAKADTRVKNRAVVVDGRVVYRRAPGMRWNGPEVAHA